MQTAKLRLGLPRANFFDGLDPEYAEAVSEAIGVLRKLTGAVTDVQLPPAVNAATIWGPETYAYHAKWLTESPEKYQAATRNQMIRSNEIKPDAYAQARRQVDQVRREIKKTFLDVDLLITPTMKTPPATIAAALNAPPAPSPAASGAVPRNPPAGGLNTVGAFDVYGLPAITLPCGFTRSGLPIGLQISAAPFAESTMLALAHAYEQTTQWHTRRPALN